MHQDNKHRKIITRLGIRIEQALFDKVRSGSVRILLGSTQKMGSGTNVQKRFVPLHHLDAPWKPAEVEQRDGRILRQCNENKEVSIYRNVTQGSFDAPKCFATVAVVVRLTAQLSGVRWCGRIELY